MSRSLTLFCVSKARLDWPNFKSEPRQLLVGWSSYHLAIVLFYYNHHTHHHNLEFIIDVSCEEVEVCFWTSVDDHLSHQHKRVIIAVIAHVGCSWEGDCRPLIMLRTVVYSFSRHREDYLNILIVRYSGCCKFQQPSQQAIDQIIIKLTSLALLTRGIPSFFAWHKIILSAALSVRPSMQATSPLCFQCITLITNDWFSHIIMFLNSKKRRNQSESHASCWTSDFIKVTFWFWINDVTGR